MGLPEPAYARRGAERRPSRRLVRKRGIGDQIEHDIVGRIERGGDLLQNHVTLARKLGPVEAGREDDVAQNVKGNGEILAQDTGVIGSAVDAGRRVDLAADRLDLLGDVERASRGRSLEGHVLEKMSVAMLTRFLAAGPGAHPDAERYGFDLSHRVADHGQAIGKL
jgi:hypothetical protein